MDNQEDSLDREIRQLVIERLKEIPSGKKISIGGKGDFTMGELIKRVEKNDEVGKKIVEIQMKFLQSLKTGALLNEWCSDKTTKPNKDKTAELFLEPSNLVMTSLIKGNSAKESSKRSKDEFKRNIRKLLASESPQEDKSPVQWLYWDMLAQVCLGDGEAKL